MKKPLSALLSCLPLLAALAWAAPVEAGPRHEQELRAELVEGYVRQARALKLAESRGWRRLGHYRKGIFGWVSEADNKAFFLSPEGNSNAALELEATIRGLFREPRPEDEELQHPYCRFPARLAWLHGQLNFDLERLGQRRCPRYAEFKAVLRPQSLTMVFSSYYLNNPASAFGHTFLRVNKQGQGGRERGEELLDYGIDYSATVDTTNSLIYAIKGLTGLFPGTFRKLPYYLKVREYNDYESRDMWEYELELSRTELDMVIAHLWELGSTHFDYYYLTENCSYHVLAALEVANPRLELVRHLRWPVIPADTIKALFAVPGLVRAVHFRPSNRTLFQQRLTQLNEVELAALALLASDPGAPQPAELSQASRVRVLDAALDYADYVTARDLLNDAPSAEKRYKQVLLERRASILVPSEDLSVEPPWRLMPQRGHGTLRAGLGGGHVSSTGYMYALDLRLALHSLDDPAEGYPEHLQIEFLPTELRYGLEDQTLTLEQLSLVRILSLTPLARYTGDLSWTLNAGLRRIRDEGCDGCVVGAAMLGGGAALSFFDDGLIVYGMVGNHLQGVGKLDGIGGLPLRAGLGPFGGVRLRYTSKLVTLVEGDFVYLPFQDPDYTWDVRAVTRWLYARDAALVVEARSQPDAHSLRVLSSLYF